MAEMVSSPPTIHISPSTVAGQLGGATQTVKGKDRSLSFRGAGRTTNKVCKEPGTDEDVNKWLLLSQTPKLEGILEGGSSWPNS